MKLNAEILYMELSADYSVDMYGPSDPSLNLSHPEFYMDHSGHFETDHLYLATADHLPARPRIDRNSVLISIGEPFRMHYYTERLTLLVIRSKQEYFSVYMKLQSIFEKYNNWNSRLFDVFQNECDIQEIIDCSSVVFGCPMYLIDSAFHFAAVHHFNKEAEEQRWKLRDESGFLSRDSLSTYMKTGSMEFDIHTPIVFEYDSGRTIAVNLYDRTDTYVGCLCVDCSERANIAGIGVLSAYLGHILEKSLDRNPFLLLNERNSKKQLLRCLIEELPMTSTQRSRLRAENGKHSYVCASLHMLDTGNALPSGYICSICETTFPGSMAFTYRDTIVLFIDVEGFCTKSGFYQEKLNNQLTPLLKSLLLYAGISNKFSELYDAKRQYQQAEIAIENGILTSEDSQCFFFSSYILMEMVSNSLGGLPPEVYFSKGFKALLKHDKEAEVSYLETLKVFLEENMNYSKAAEALFIHRSTLIDRIARIERDLEIDLKDYNERLQLQLLIKALEIQELLGK